MNTPFFQAIMPEFGHTACARLLVLHSVLELSMVLGYLVYTTFVLVRRTMLDRVTCRDLRNGDE